MDGSRPVLKAVWKDKFIAVPLGTFENSPAIDGWE
jgi:hypothetical protein